MEQIIEINVGDAVSILSPDEKYRKLRGFLFRVMEINEDVATLEVISYKRRPKEKIPVQELYLEPNFNK